MDRGEIENALATLQSLLDDPDSSETDYQRWFEHHPVIFKAYGHRRHIPHPKLRDGEKTYVPVFMCQRLDETWEVFELKRPDTKILRKKDRREQFYSELESYYAQCREYSQHFSTKTNREQFNKTYQTNIQNDVSAIMVAGRNEYVDRLRVHRLLADRGSKVSHQTFDDVKNRLEFYRADLFAKYENNKGISIHFLCVPYRLRRRQNFLLDYGTTLEKNRISIFIDKYDRLSFEIRDVNGDVYRNRTRLKHLGIEYGVITSLVFEMGIGDDYSFLNIEANGFTVADRRLDRFDIEISPADQQVIGSNVIGDAETCMDTMEIAVFERTLSFTERLDLARSLAREYLEYFKDPTKLPNRMKFRGNQFLYSNSHPNFQDRNTEE